MAEIKFTKNELRQQQQRLAQLNKYLPTLQLKKAMLQVEVHECRLQIQQLEEEFGHLYERAQGYATLLTEQTMIDPKSAVEVQEVKKRWENIAGIEVPIYEGISFAEMSYSLFETPPWLDSVLLAMRSLIEVRAKVSIAEEKKKTLEEEFRQVSIRVNLFEKILIPRALENIKKIKVFLGDQELASVSRAKVAKKKIEEGQTLCATM